ncbi:hypothetical protein C8Q73DRAFT_476319 [Cubamyces lactineus]|nr:hypothetical protein C8Q73DRAFT_476319 [Cubamyces lactineus]
MPSSPRIASLRPPHISLRPVPYSQCPPPPPPASLPAEPLRAPVEMATTLVNRPSSLARCICILHGPTRPDHAISSHPILTCIMHFHHRNCPSMLGLCSPSTLHRPPPPTTTSARTRSRPLRTPASPPAVQQPAPNAPRPLSQPLFSLPRGRSGALIHDPHTSSPHGPLPAGTSARALSHPRADASPLPSRNPGPSGSASGIRTLSHTLGQVVPRPTFAPWANRA